MALQLRMQLKHIVAPWDSHPDGYHQSINQIMISRHRGVFDWKNVDFTDPDEITSFLSIISYYILKS